MIRSHVCAQSANTCSVKYSTLRTVINQIWTLKRFEIDKLAKYMRCLLQVTLPYDDAVAHDLMSEIFERVKESDSVSASHQSFDRCLDRYADSRQADKSFPPEELEWLITTAFNHGVDMYLAHQDELCKEWVAHAFNMVALHRDGGLLQASLQDHYTHLTWEST
jgi:hypothetical protein